MLVHIVSFGGGVAVLGSRNIMAVSRAWGNSFAGLRRLHSLRAVSFSSGNLLHPTFEPLVQQSPASSRHVRFFAHAAALEDSSDPQQKRGVRLSRAERYALVENFVQRHKEAHEGKVPSVSAIVKEIGGSRVIVKDIVEELEKNAQVNNEGDPPNAENNTLDTSTIQVRSGSEGIDDEEHEEEYQEGPIEVVVPEQYDDLKATYPGSESLLREDGFDPEEHPSSISAPSQAVEPDRGLWRRLRDLGQQEGQNDAQRSSTFGLDDDYDSEDDDDDGDDEEEDEVDDERRDGSENLTKSAGSRYLAESSTGESYGMFIRFLPLTATEADLRASFQDCGEITRAQAMVPRGSGLKFTYGFVDFSTLDALAKALKKDKVFIKGSTILTEACSGARRTSDRFKKPETYRNSDRSADVRPANGGRSSAVNRFKPPTIENGSKSSTNGACLVAVEGLPYPMPISAVEKMLSAHGTISRSELAREEGGTYSAHVEFKTEEARDSALASSRVYLGGRWCRITTGEPILTTVVRLANVGNASENLILQRCAKLGRVDNIVQRKEGVVDVYYHPSELRNMRKILDRLGEVIADFKRWQANLAPKCTLEEIRNSAEIQDWVEGQKDRLLDNLTNTMKSMLIDIEDLRELVEAERMALPSNSGKSRNFDRSSPVKSNNRL